MLSNYADDDNLFSIGKDINKVKDALAKDLVTVTNWFETLKNVTLCVFAETEIMKYLFSRCIL